MFAVVVFLVWNFEALSYGLRQGYGQLQVIMGAVAVEKAIATGSFDSAQVAKIRLIKKIRDFAFDTLGLRRNASYTKIYDQKRKPLLWLVVACEPYRLVAKTWDFPVVGSFSYKGFFSQAAAQSLTQQLAQEGYDTLVRPVSAWSTLGLLSDPILSQMLELEAGDLAELIIHELTHGTIYLKNSVEYNENLANFIGQQGAKLFLQSYFGNDSPELSSYLLSLQTQQNYTRKVVSFATELDALYQKKDVDLPLLKKQKMQEFKEWVVGNQDFHPKFREKFAKRNLNNAYFYSFLQYNESEADFQYEFESEAGGDLIRYIAYLRSKYGTKRLIFW